MSTDLRVPAYPRQLTPVAIYLSKPDVIRNQIANSPPPRCQPLYELSVLVIGSNVQATFDDQRPRFYLRNMPAFQQQISSLKETPQPEIHSFETVSPFENPAGDRDAGWKCRTTFSCADLAHTFRADSNRAIPRLWNSSGFARVERLIDGETQPLCLHSDFGTKPAFAQTDAPTCRP